MTKDTIIGLFNYYDDYEPITFEELNKKCEEPNCKWTLAQYLDRRVATDLTRFNYDPWTGEKIEWNKLRKRIANKLAMNK